MTLEIACKRPVHSTGSLWHESHSHNLAKPVRNTGHQITSEKKKTKKKKKKKRRRKNAHKHRGTTATKNIRKIYLKTTTAKTRGSVLNTSQSTAETNV